MRGAEAAIILAGGEGRRLRALTRLIAGDDRPKQFCPVLGGESLLDRTRRRTARLVPAERTRTVVTRAHERYYAPALAGADPGTVVVQPEGRGTAPAILYALLRLPAGTDVVAVFPSDHHIAGEELFLGRVEGALEAVRARPDVIVLLGIEPDRAEPSYGWIEPGERVPGPWPLYRVRRFWEKPSPAIAARLMRRRCLWNSFVMVAAPATLIAAVAAAEPRLAAAFEPLRRACGTPAEAEAARAAYAAIADTDFSRGVLQQAAARLAVLPAGGIGWNDLGEPARVRATLRMAGLELPGA